MFHIQNGTLVPGLAWSPAFKSLFSFASWNLIEVDRETMRHMLWYSYMQRQLLYLKLGIWITTPNLNSRVVHVWPFSVARWYQAKDEGNTIKLTQTLKAKTESKMGEGEGGISCSPSWYIPTPLCTCMLSHTCWRQVKGREGSRGSTWGTTLAAPGWAPLSRVCCCSKPHQSCSLATGVSI